MSTTSKGAPYPETNDGNSAPAWLEQLAEWASARPGTSAFTTAQRDVLVGPDLWEGRVIFNLDTDRLEVNKTGAPGAGSWTSIGEELHAHAATDVTSGTLAIARLPVAASGTSSSTQVVRADDARLSDARQPVAGSAIKPCNVQTFAANGTWAKPAGAVRVRVILIGGGGAGAAGPLGPGSRGGGGGALVDVTLPASRFGASHVVTVGAGGTNATAIAGTTSVTIGDITFRAGGGGGAAAPGFAGKGGLATANGLDSSDPVQEISSRIGGPGGDANGAGNPAPAIGAGAGASFEDPSYYAYGKGAGGAVLGAGDVAAGLPGGGGQAPGGGGAAGASGQAGAACFITYFD